jgi:hypothetical protein
LQSNKVMSDMYIAKLKTRSSASEILANLSRNLNYEGIVMLKSKVINMSFSYFNIYSLV